MSFSKTRERNVISIRALIVVSWFQDWILVLNIHTSYSARNQTTLACWRPTSNLLSILWAGCSCSFE